MPDSDRTGYHGPPRRPEDVIASAFRNEELMRQLVASYEEERRGVPPVPWRQVLDGERARRHARTRRRTA
ncbi:MAG: hypothetical protein ACRDJE_21135 [Dehalococcoidia bacterium]